MRGGQYKPGIRASAPPAASYSSAWAPTRSRYLSAHPGAGTDHHRNIPLCQHLPTAIALAASGKIELDRMVTARYGLDQAETALQEAGNPEAIKVIVRPGE